MGPVRQMQKGMNSAFHRRMYTVNHKKGGSTFVIMTLGNLDRFLQFFYCCKEEEIIYSCMKKYPPHLNIVRTLPFIMHS